MVMVHMSAYAQVYILAFYQPYNSHPDIVLQRTLTELLRNEIKTMEQLPKRMMHGVTWPEFFGTEGKYVKIEVA